MIFCIGSVIALPIKNICWFPYRSCGECSRDRSWERTNESDGMSKKENEPV